MNAAGYEAEVFFRSPRGPQIVAQVTHEECMLRGGQVCRLALGKNSH
ncbi:MarR family transcriptional regulator [Pseudomonas sp. S31]|nr:MarR family transcriptional regulator [Pseudomonas sp. S31]